MISSSFKSYAHGKLLLTGEYFVLDGARALAVPTRLGQHFSVNAVDGPLGHIDWISLDHLNDTWFTGRFLNVDGFEIVKSSDEVVAGRICQLLNQAVVLRPILLQCPSIQVSTKLEFPNSWGLGSSSTLVFSLAKWLDINAYDLLNQTFGGSGYDLACAEATGPVFYKRLNGTVEATPVNLNWPFKDQLYFVYLGEKQDSREGILHYNKYSVDDKEEIRDRIAILGEELVAAKDLVSFMEIVEKHEAIIASTLELPKVKEVRFNDFDGCIKSLGAWGGDYVLVASANSAESVAEYFTSRGYPVIRSWKELILDYQDQEKNPQ